MIALLLSMGLSSRAAKLVAYVAVPLIIIAVLYFAINAYGNARYDAGVTATDAKWEAASTKLVEQAAKSAKTADDASFQRATEFATDVAIEKEKLDEAEQTGASSLDVLFPSTGGM